MDNPHVMREYILNWINTYRHGNSDLFYHPSPYLAKKVRAGKIVLDIHGIILENKTGSYMRARWPEHFDFHVLNDEELIHEFTLWMIKSMKQR